MIVALEVAAGLALGYFLGSLIESIWHEYIPDAPPRVQAVWKRYPRLCRLMMETHFYHHAIHHHQTYRTNHVTQFDSDEQRARLEAFLLRRGSFGQIIIRNGFANRLHTEALPVFSLPWIALALTLGLVLPVGVALPVALMLTLPGLFSYVVHPWIHLPFAEGQRRASPLMAAFLRTPYMKAVYRHHFLHHRHGATGNYNLVLGGDALRGRSRKADAEDLRVMREIGLPVD